MNDNNNELKPPLHPSVISELEELEALTLLMLTADMSAIALESRGHLLALAHRIVTVALNKAHGTRT